MPGLKTHKDLVNAPKVRGAGSHFIISVVDKDIREMSIARVNLERSLRTVNGHGQAVNYINRSAPEPDVVKRMTALQRGAFNNRLEFKSLADDAEKSLAMLKTNRNWSYGIATLQVLIAAGKWSEFCLSILPLSREGMMLKEELEGWFFKLDIAETVGAGAKAAMAHLNGKQQEETVAAIGALTKAANLFGVNIKELGGLIGDLYELQKGQGSTLKEKLDWASKVISAISNLVTALGNLAEAIGGVKRYTTRLKALGVLIGPINKMCELLTESLKAQEEISRVIEANKQISKAETHLARMQVTDQVSKASKEAMEKFNFDLAKFDKECENDAKRMSAVLKSIRNRSDALAWSKAFTDRLALVHQKQRSMKEQRRKEQERYENALNKLPGHYKEFEEKEAALLKNFDLMLRKVDFEQAKSVLDYYLKSIMDTFQKNGITRHKYMIHWTQSIHAANN